MPGGCQAQNQCDWSGARKRPKINRRMPTRPESSLTPTYADRLESRASSRWRKYLGVQLPYRWNLRRLGLGFVLDVGCGVGRNLAHLDGRGVGVDPNTDCVEAAKQRGLRAYTP